MAIEIIQSEIDMADKYRYWVKLEDGRTAMFKFQSEPSEAEIQEAIDRFMTIVPPEE